MDEQTKHMLRMAAKAAGIVPDTNQNTGPIGNDGFSSDSRGVAISWGRLLFWNPLNDDGDALRLAVKLRLDVMTCGRHVQDEIQIGGAVASTTFQPVGALDLYAATRLAITRAAAAIGEAMQ